MGLKGLWFTTGLVLLLLMQQGNVSAQSFPEDTIRVEKFNNFYDSLKSKAQHKKITRLLHNFLIANPKKGDPLDSALFEAPLEGKTISDIRIIRLDVFGPSLRDTSRKATLWYEKAGNLMHTRSDLHNIRKNLVFKKGDPLQTSELYENERLLRALPYIKDARFIVEPDTLLEDLVRIVLLIQDRFSIGVTGDVNGFKSAALEFYNKNIFGVGHELSTRLVGHLTREPFMGIEAFYKINNISGRFINFTAGYMNTYMNEGAMVRFEKPFLRTSDTWGYGAAGYTYKRTPYLPGELHIKNKLSLGLEQTSLWGGRNFQLGTYTSRSQITLSGQYIHLHFSDRPPPLSNGEQYYFNSDMFLAGITWSERKYQPDELVYGYGITEDIPKGFKNELVMGYDKSETGGRVYSHLHISNGNLMHAKPGYMQLSATAGGYLQSGNIRQGLVEFSGNFISRLFGNDNRRYRQFIGVDYKLGINRFEMEKLVFEKTNLIRGFESNEVFGKQRLSINAETVYFQKRDFYRFNLAFFIFGDLGIIGPENRSIFKGSYYSGLGAGLRLHNESLVFKTIQVRLTFYPNHPKDVGLVGFLLNEQSRQSFYSFQPGPPSPRRFE